MTDVADFQPLWLAAHVRKTGDSSELIAHIEKGGELTLPLRSLIVGILQGTIEAIPKPKTKMKVLSSNLRRKTLKQQHKFIKKNLQQDDQWELWEPTLQAVGIFQVPETPTARTSAAKAILARWYGLSAAQLNELMYPRAARSKAKELG